LRTLGRVALRVLGFRVEGDFPNLPKFVVIAAPHTSNWDFPVGLAAKLATGIGAAWIGKHTIFRWPFETILRWVGGIPVDRSASSDVVGQLVAEFARRPQMVLALAPEGTRKKVERWKTGFYRIAQGANVPIVPVALDFGNKAVRIMPAFTPTGDQDADIAELRRRFDNVRGKNR
jgi:1-acyl-sn-glycerol-3-phosphate acyltransferase